MQVSRLQKLRTICFNNSPREDISETGTWLLLQLPSTPDEEFSHQCLPETGHSRVT